MRELTRVALVFALAMAICGVWALAQANPVQTSSHGSPAQSQVYGDQSSSAAAKGGNAKVGNVSATAAPANATARGGRGGQGGNAQGGNVVNNINTPGNGYGGGYYAGPSNPALAASAIAPAIISGGCAGAGASAALQLPGFGLGGGAVKIDRVCQLHMIGEDAAARELLCQQDDIRRAFSAAGEPCAADLKPYIVAPTPVATTQYPYDYCETRHAGDKDQHRECDHKVN